MSQTVSAPSTLFDRYWSADTSAAALASHGWRGPVPGFTLHLGPGGMIVTLAGLDVARYPAAGKTRPDDGVTQ